jgi:uncharacterized protein with GYD domain
LRQHPEDRTGAVRESIEAAGGRLHGLWYAIGEYDGMALWEAPDLVSMNSAIVATRVAGAHIRIDTTVLLDVEEGLQALEQSSAIDYRVPGSQTARP